MSVDPNAVSDQNGVASGEPNQDTVKYDTYRKVLGEAKSLKQKISEYEAKEQEREQSVLAEQGKFKEALEQERKARLQTEESLKATEKAFAKKIFTKEVQELALQFGARKEALEDIVKVGDWTSVEMDENFSVNQEQLKTAITNLSKSKPYYFSSATPAPRDVNLSSNAPKGKSLNEMTKAEILAQLKQS